MSLQKEVDVVRLSNSEFMYKKWSKKLMYINMCVGNTGICVNQMRKLTYH